MSQSFVQFQSPALLKRLDALANLPRSRAFYTLRQRIAGAIERGNRAGRLAGTDGRGRALTPLRSKRKGKYKGATGPPLAPFRDRSRVVTNFRATWRQQGTAWALEMGWADIVSRRGVPFLIYHLTGARPQPKRDIAGLSPRTQAELRGFYSTLLPDLLAEASPR